MRRRYSRATSRLSVCPARRCVAGWWQPCWRPGAAAPVDLVLADPPYEVENADIHAVLAALTTHGWAREGTLAVVERAAGSTPLSWPTGWQPWPQRVYGDTRLELAERL